MSISKGMDKEDDVHIYSGILFNHKKNKIGLFIEMWMNMKSVIQREMSEREKQITHICA